jgi:hypothetical protein
MKMNHVFGRIIFFVVTVFAVMLIFDGMQMKGDIKNGVNINNRADRIYTYSIILAVALGLQVLTGMMMMARR